MRTTSKTAKTTKTAKTGKTSRASARRAVVSLLVCAILVLSTLLSGCAGRGDEATTGNYPYSPSNPGMGDSGAPSAEYYYYEGEQYLEIEEQGVRYTDEEPTTTFSLKVDTAAYSNVHRYLESGSLPPADAVRTEELINYFSYDTKLTFDNESPFALYTEVGPSPFDPTKQLAFIRAQTKDIDKDELPPSNLVFLIDISGSMDSYDKLPLLQQAFGLLVETLGEQDRVSIVTYAGDSRVVLNGAHGNEGSRIESAINDLYAGGSTAGGKGIQTAYELAADYFIKGGNNRVILATDGDFNVGISDVNKLERFIAEKRDTGVYLSVLGFGTGNIRDDIMETLSKNGNGNYSYIDSTQTAKKVLVTELGSNLFTVADDVKAQVTFDPATVKSYRLIGYENRMLANEDFEDDRKDAGEMGAGSNVVILFELELYGAEDDLRAETAQADAGNLFEVSIRYKNPGEQKSQLVSTVALLGSESSRNTTDFGFAASVALFGDVLRHPDERNAADNLAAARELAQANLGQDTEGYRADFLAMLNQLEDDRLIR